MTEGFAEFYEGLRKRKPFPWMVRLAQLMAAGEFPEVIDLPTGAGKSEVVLVWAWARRVNPKTPRRLWMLSDRRVIVDQTFAAAECLRALEIDGRPIVVSRLRGGLATSERQAFDPVATQVTTATVDQYGSRLLFRGYGASPRSWPIWAGLAGNDSLVVLDEAHLSPVALDTFEACRRLGAGIRTISMTATPRLGAGMPFGLAEDDREHPVLSPRLLAKRVVELRTRGSLVDAAHELIEASCRRIAVICNTVRVARETFNMLTGSGKIETHLLIGRQRPIDRDRLLETLVPRLASGAPDSAPLLVVSTQCIEAGADWDFDGMVSEACPIDALRQRLGRLDRIGRQGESLCILLKPGDREAPPYGGAPSKTWSWLKSHADKNKIDLGVEAWRLLAEFVPDDARSRRPEPVSLFAPCLRKFAWTSPRPIHEPDVDLLLHGKDTAPGTIGIVWRRDIDETDIDSARDILGVLPPDTLETCEVPLWEARAWLAKAVIGDVGDIEGAVADEAARRSDRQMATSAYVLRWIGGEELLDAVPLGRLRPGDTIMLPSHRGGCDRYGWAPLSDEPVLDLAEYAYAVRHPGAWIERFDDPNAEVERPTRGRVHRCARGVVVIHAAEQRASPPANVAVDLHTHQARVAERARLIAIDLALDPAPHHRAGLHHDDGKREPQWQLKINGDDIARATTMPLARGTYARSSLSRLPVGWRHEARSLAGLPAEVPGLVRWLVATHHGYARPFWPIRDADHGIGLAELMDELQREHGVWGLALQEAVFRSADQAIAQEEESARGNT